MADDVATPSNPPIAPVQQEELEEVPLDLDVSQRPREEESPRRSGAHSSCSFSMGSSTVS